MNNLFQPGQEVWLEIAGEPCQVAELLGSGGQGHVYRATVGGSDGALKWYFPQNAQPAQREAISQLISKGAPNDRFLWPLDLASSRDFPGFGYLMPLREPRFRGMAELMNREIDPTFHTLATVAIELADSFLELHSKGLCYSDISFGNIFLDPETGEVAICDNDNVSVDGEGNSGVIGTPRFMAPEMVAGQMKPNTNTDLYSLSVILFYIFMIHHPLEGRRERDIDCLDLSAMQELYGNHARFIFDPIDDTNRPVPGIHDNAILFWEFYPGYVRQTFTRAFTVGLADPTERVRESEWRAIFTRMRDQIYYCHACAAENFLPEENDDETLPDQACWHCGEKMTPPLRLRIGHQSIVLNQDIELYPHHLDPERRYDYSEPWARVVPHPTRPDTWGLQNLSIQTWITTPPSGRKTYVPQGKSVSLTPGLNLRFGNIEGVVL